MSFPDCCTNELELARTAKKFQYRNFTNRLIIIVIIIIINVLVKSVTSS